MFLARSLGKTLREVGDMPGYEFALWLAEYELAPWAPFDARPSQSDPMEFAKPWQ